MTGNLSPVKDEGVLVISFLRVRLYFRRIRLAALPLATIFGCSNPAKKVTTQLSSFAMKAPFTLTVAESKYSGYGIGVNDVAQESYRDLFQFIDPHDTSRAAVYLAVPRQLLYTLPIIRVISIRTSKIGGDTTRATLEFVRPERVLYEKSIDPLIHQGDTLPPSPRTSARFREALVKARAGLQSVDTALIDVVAGPRIVRVVTLGQLREMAADDSIRRAALGGLKAILPGTVVTLTEFRQGMRMEGVSVGGSVSGFVDFGPNGWQAIGATYFSAKVRCLGVRGQDTTSTTAYLLDDRLVQGGRRSPFLCAWYGTDEEASWFEVRPVALFARFVVSLGGDSVTSPWTRLR